MNKKWAVLAGFAALILVVAMGCLETSGGSSSNDGPGTTNKPVVVQICFGQPICSTVGAGSLNGAVFNAAAGYLYVSPACSDSNANMYVWIKVVTSAAAFEVDHYIWSIRNWTGAAPDGIFTSDSYDSVVDTNGVFQVKTSSNQIRYMSATAADLRALTSAYNQMIDVTAVNKDGQMASGYVSLYLYNGMTTGGTTIYGSLHSRDNAANIRPGSSADYYSILGSGATNVLDLEGDFDTYLALYDTNLNAIAVNDDVIPGLNLNSQLASFLTNGVTYYVEATSLSNSTAGNFSINSDTDALMPIPSPFVSGGSCGSIAGDYSVNETLVISLTFNGQRYSLTNVSSASVTITQTGCDFTYPVVDPTGTIPPTLLMGRIDYNDLELYSEAIIPQTSELFITSSSVTGTGLIYGGGLTMEATGTVTGSYLGVPFQLDFKSTSTFSK